MIIYKVTNIKNNKSYIGQTTQKFSIKKTQHIRYDKHLQTHFYRALKKYGKENFEWEIIEKCNSKNELDEMEYHYIKQYNSFNNGYNITMGGEGTLGRIVSQLTRKLISKANKGKYEGKNNPNYGNKWTDEQKERMSKQRLGKNNPMFGKEPHNIKEYIITTPEGLEIKILGLKRWCKKQQLFSSGFFNILSGKCKYYKKYKIRRINH